MHGTCERRQLGTLARGHYVPNRAIAMRDSTQIVFTVEDGHARLREVSLHESHKELRRVTGPGIRDGALLVVGGTHFLSDGQPVQIRQRLP